MSWFNYKTGQSHCVLWQDIFQKGRKSEGTLTRLHQQRRDIQKPTTLFDYEYGNECRQVWLVVLTLIMYLRVRRDCLALLWVPVQKSKVINQNINQTRLHS